ncbi:MAG: ABC transporter ATP-binding protein [Wujia sp.]
MIETRELTKIYNSGRKNAFQALTKVSFRIEDGEMVAIIGKSGAGKSTLLHIMGAMDDYDDGKCLINGRNIKGLSENKLAEIRNQEIGIVMQDFALIEDYTVAENIELPLFFGGVKGKEKKRLVKAAMESTGIAELADKTVKKLSGGQKQRTAIARAIVSNPDYILADEPTGALDTKTSAEIMDLFKELNEKGKTVIIITHDPQVANQCDRIIEISDGRIKQTSQAI